jgi:hypothetical protein
MDSSKQASLRQILIDAKVDETIIDQFFDKLVGEEEHDAPVDNVEQKISEITLQIQEESDWRKRATLAAERVKLGLDRT